MSVQRTPSEDTRPNGDVAVNPPPDQEQRTAAADQKPIEPQRPGVFIPMRVLLHTTVIIIAVLVAGLVAFIPGSGAPIGAGIAVAALLYTMRSPWRRDHP
ncbi:hypothetical protein [Actinomadura formosensis]|uniref:hypothetical protein n=1 Tax=Actinomadura formosensis TaxID=60706 RepID=UPI003D8F301A